MSTIDFTPLGTSAPSAGGTTVRPASGGIDFTPMDQGQGMSATTPTGAPRTLR